MDSNFYFLARRKKKHHGDFVMMSHIQFFTVKIKFRNGLISNKWTSRRFSIQGFECFSSPEIVNI